jgi:hypothetical protein
MSDKKHSFYKVSIAAVIFCGVLISSVLMTGQPAVPRVPLGIASDWTQHHILYPDSSNPFVNARIRRDPRWVQNWYLRHPEAWWPEYHRGHGGADEGSRRDWSVSLSASPLTSGFEPLFDFTFAIGPTDDNTGYGSLNTTDNGNGEFRATAGTLTVTGGNGDEGAYSLYPGGPGQTTSPSGKFLYDNLLYPSIDPLINNNGPLFTGNGFEINIWSNGANSYEYADYVDGAYAIN